MYIHIYIHTYIRIYIHTYIRMIHTYIHTYIHIHTYMHTYNGSLEGINLPSGDLHARAETWQSRKQERLDRMRRELDDKLNSVCTFQPNVDVGGGQEGGGSGDLRRRRRGREEGLAYRTGSSGSLSPLSREGGTRGRRLERERRWEERNKGEQASKRLYYQALHLKSPHIVGLFCPYSRSLLTLVWSTQGMKEQRRKQRELRQQLELHFRRICPFQPNAGSDQDSGTDEEEREETRGRCVCVCVCVCVYPLTEGCRSNFQKIEEW
jgi:hypothetical protein